MTAPRWTVALLSRLAPRGGAEDVVGDLEEAHRLRVERRGRLLAVLLTSFDALEMALVLALAKRRPPRLFRRLAVPISWLDFKLGLRMLVRYPGLTVVGGLAIAFAVCVAVGTFEFVNQVVSPRLPLPDGDRIVAIQIQDQESAGFERRAMQDFLFWREELESVEELGAFRTFQRNLAVGEGPGEPVEVAEISPSAFRVAGTAPLAGRTLDAADELPDAPPVVLLGDDVVEALLDGDLGVVGRTVRLGGREATVVGVMPKGFGFPDSQSVWVPLRPSTAGYPPREGPAVGVFGRLAPGVSLEQAQAELRTLGARASADLPESHRYLVPRIVPFARSILDTSGGGSLLLLAIDAFVVMLLVLACGNVALLMFARAASRESEIAVRSALGASRGRVVGQLFAEALALGVVSAVVGVAAASFGLQWWLGAAEVVWGDQLPFWFTSRLSPVSVLYAAGLTLLGAAIAGVLPALRVTRGFQARLQQQSSGGGGLRFGGVWTAVIVIQVAFTVAVPAFAFFVRRDIVQIESVDVGFSEEEYLTARLGMDRDPRLEEETDAGQAAFLVRFRAATEELEGRLAADPAVIGVVLADRLPRMYHPAKLIEMDEGGAAPLVRSGPAANCDGSCVAYRTSSAAIEPGYFDVLRVPILSGRGFVSGELGSAIVNLSFVERVLGGRNPIGRRLRYLRFDESGRRMEPGPWHEIVGVVRDMGMGIAPDPKIAGVYHPLSVDTYPVHLAVHVRADPASYGGALRLAADEVDTALRLDDVLLLSEVDDHELRLYSFWFWVTLLVGAVATLLSLAGIYSIMSFAESRRTREIGIRIALGSSRAGIAATVFRRPLTQVAAGVVAGACVAGALSFAILGESLWPQGAGVVLAYAVLMMGVCLLACIVPTRRALSVEPSEALRAD